MKHALKLGGFAVFLAIGVAVFWLWRGDPVYRGKGYTVTCPAGWKAMEFPAVDVAFVPPETAEESGFRSNVNIVVVPRGEGVATGDQTFQRILQGLKTSADDFVLLDSRDGVFDGMQHSSLRYSFSAQGQKLKGTMYIVGAQQIYIFSYTTLDALHDKYADAFQRLVASLRFD
ncbi:MAG: DcrB-related protein [Solidesulfovibrio sp.]|jgi:hypothetical protein|uniref:DcrB-related protein n=1 Tax=Solidesulfovibrio sp. TaxID=2910990 RepID=UPI002B221796|nr:DcrB-related protein [Solidesulfovibrio sp.]MEA4858248.1 DcrB-related protein [Solidesulfovibrio sp.]